MVEAQEIFCLKKQCRLMATKYKGVQFSIFSRGYFPYTDTRKKAIWKYNIKILHLHYLALAQWLVRLIEDQGEGGSNPSRIINQ